MSLKAALFEMNECIGNQEIGQSEDTFIQELEEKHGLSAGSLVFYFNQLMMAHMHQENSSQASEGLKKVNRKWTKGEIEFMFQYIQERQEQGGLNITELLEEVAQLLTRGYQSVNYKYYSLLKEKEKKQKAEQQSYHFTTISQSEIPVAATEVIEEVSQFQPFLTQPEVPQATNPKQNEGLLDILSGLITNVEQLPGIQLTELLNSIYQLTNMALQNQQAAEQLENVKHEVHQEKIELREQLILREQQLILEKKRNDQLQVEVAKLAREIAAFNKLGDAAKIQNLKSYNQRLNYIIDGFGVVVQVGS